MLYRAIKICLYHHEIRVVQKQVIANIPIHCRQFQKVFHSFVNCFTNLLVNASVTKK